MDEKEKISILIVDDDPEIVNLISQTLKFFGFHNKHMANSGKEALQILGIPEKDDKPPASNHEIDIIILDIMLPDINGLEVCQRIKEVFPDVSVILISGHTVDSLHKMLIDSKADDFVTKPFNPNELIARIQILVDKRIRLKREEEKLENIANVKKHQMAHIGDSIDEYDIVDILGWGKSTVIYKVVEKESKNVFAVKLLTKYSLGFESVLARFAHEIKVLSRINHPNIIKLYKTGTHENCPYIVMEYVEGNDLEQYFITKWPPSLETFFRVATELAQAIEGVHNAGIHHRDIKPKNILIDKNSGTVKLSDFGISRCIDEDLGITSDGMILGTPIYMAPEIFIGDKSTIHSDIYSYGVTLYHFAANFPPFTADTPSSLYKKHTEEPPEKFSKTLKLKIPPELEVLITDQCMAKEPDKRPTSMSQVLKILEEINRKYQITTAQKKGIASLLK